jgi:hypothetical protein
MSDVLEIPSFLTRERSSQPIHLKLANLGRRRWKARKIERPAGNAWETAVLIDVTFKDEAPKIGCGRRYVWAREGRRWCKLAGLDGRKDKITMAAWVELMRGGRHVA